MTILPLAERSGGVLPLGAQRPRILHVPPFVTSAGEEAIELAALAGLELDEWQQFVLISALGERPDGKWAAQTVGLTVGRQNGKGSVLEARELCGLFLLGERLINHTAHQQKTATSHYKRMLRLIESVPEFDQRVLSAPKGKGSEAIVLRGGQEIFFATRSGGGGRGLTADLQVYDEAMYLTEQDRSSLAPTMAARSMHGNIQTWYAGSAPDEDDPAQDGVPFAQVRESGIAKGKGVAYFEWSAPGEDPSKISPEVAADPAIWAMANPGLGIRISHEWVEHERTVEMGRRGFNVERLGVGAWPDTSEDAGRKIPRAWWDACLELASGVDPASIKPVCFAFDVSPDRSSSAISVAGPRADGLWQIATIMHEPDVDWVVDELEDLARAHRPAAVMWDKLGQANSLAEDLADSRIRKLKLKPIDTRELVQACGSFFDAVKQGTVRHIGQPSLDEAVDGAGERTLTDAWAWSRRVSTADITPLVSCTLAFWAASSQRKRKPGVVDLAAALAAAEAAEKNQT